VHLGDRGQPLGGELVDEHRPVERRDPLAHVGAVVGVGHALAGAEGLDHLLDRRQGPDRDLGHRRRVAQAVGVEERLAVALGQPVAALPRRRGVVVGLEQAADGLLLEPLPGVALVDARPFRELLAGQRVATSERPVEAEAVAQVDAGELERPEQGAEQPLGERVGGGRGLRVGHGGSLLDGLRCSHARGAPSPRRLRPRPARD